LDALRCACPVPDADAVINVAGPIEEPAFVGGAKFIFVRSEE